MSGVPIVPLEPSSPGIPVWPWGEEGCESGGRTQGTDARRSQSFPTPRHPLPSPPLPSPPLFAFRSVFPNDILLVSHAPCVQGISLALEGAPKGKASAVTAWPLGGLTQFVRGGKDGSRDDWRIERMCETAHLSGPWKEGKQAWALPCLRQ